MYKTIVLKKTATLGERTITELKLQKPNVGHMTRTDAHDINSVGADIALLSALSGESESLLQKLDIEDWADIRYELQKIYAVFFGIKDSLTKEDGESENPTMAAV